MSYCDQLVVYYLTKGLSLNNLHSTIVPAARRLFSELRYANFLLSLDELGEKLERYIKRFGNKVKLVRKAERQGLIRARLEGAKAATGQVVVFLDSHCEANAGW